MKKEPELIQELDETRADLARLVVRDMKAPLAGLANLLEMADRASVRHFKAEASQYVNEALGATETLEEMVEFLSGVRKLMAGEVVLEKRVCDLASLARTIVESLDEIARAAGVQVVVTGNKGITSCDRGLMTRVIGHLVRVAIKGCPRGKSIRIQVGVIQDQVRLAVDAGDASPGTGHDADRLGITYSRLTVEAHGGKFGVDPEEGTPRRWWLRLPACREGEAQPETEASPVSRSRRYLRAHPDPKSGGGKFRSIITRGTREQFAVAVALMSVLPVLAFAYLLGDAIAARSVAQETLFFMLPSVIALMGLGIVLLARHTLEMTRLRQYLEAMSKGELPHIRLAGASEDFSAINQCLGAVIRQSDEKVKVIEAQSRALVQAAQQKVMEETVGAACHHLGQPATVIRVYLDLMRKAEVSPEMQGMIQECQAAAEEVANVLNRLQGVGTYKTEPYLSPCDEGECRADERILKI